ncbi:MAG TPA: hypothetical protein VMU22_13455 [Rhizomicrobium sp.]|nr:hypothetical protein [Rhizomicrobium sp.]
MVSALAACSYPVEPPPADAVPVITAYADRVPGKWLLIVDASKATAALAAEGTRCSRSDYPLDLSKTFAETANATFRTVTEEVRLSDHALSKSEMVSGGYSGVIVVTVAQMRAHAKTDGLLEARASADIEIDGTILVAKGGERMVDSRQTGKGEAERDAHIDCSGAGEAVAAASDTAMRDVVGKLAEQFANSHAIRYSVPGLAPQ